MDERVHGVIKIGDLAILVLKQEKIVVLVIDACMMSHVIGRVHFFTDADNLAVTVLRERKKATVWSGYLHET